MEPCQSGLTYLFAKEAGASKPLGGSNPPGSANSGLEHSRQKMRRREAPMIELNSRQTQTPPRVSTLRVAPRSQYKILKGNIEHYE